VRFTRTVIRRTIGARHRWWVLVVADGALGVFTVAGYARFTVPLAGVLILVLAAVAAPRGLPTALAALRRRGVGGAPPSSAPPPPARHELDDRPSGTVHTRVAAHMVGMKHRPAQAGHTDDTGVSPTRGEQK